MRRFSARAGPGGENLLSGTVVRRGDRTLCVIRNTLELNVPWGQPGQYRVFLRPEKIRNYRMDKFKGPSSDSPLTGTVLQMTAEGGHIRVLLDAGVPLRTIMTRQEAVDSGIFVGDQVRVEFAPDAAYTEP